jgi:hypothetical protein
VTAAIRRLDARSRAALVISVGAGLLTLAWVVAALMMAGRGLDGSDEGFYLLSYRWWHQDVRAFSGVQYVYGPVFELLDYSVRGLRIFRLVTILGTHAVFGWAFMTWLRTERPDANPSRLWEVAGTLTIVASGGVTYGWLPLSPGYNDVPMLASMLIAAVALRSFRAVRDGGRLPLLPPLALGPLAVALVLVKWSSAGVTLPFLVLVSVLGLRSMRATGWLRYVGSAVASLVVTLAAVNFLILPFSTMIPPMVRVNRMVAQATNSPTQLLDLYIRSGLDMLGKASLIALMAVAVGALGYLLARAGRRTVGSLVAVLGPPAALVVTWPDRLGLPGGGVPSLVDDYPAALVSTALAVAVALVVRALLRLARRRSESGAASIEPDPARRDDVVTPRRPTQHTLVIVLLLLLPAIAPLGTGNPVHYLAVNQFACWVALFVMAVTGLPRGTVLMRFAAAATAAALALCVSTGVDGLLVHPYRVSDYHDSTTPIGGHGNASSILVSPEEVASYDAVRAVLGDEARPGREYMGFDGQAGLIFVLGGRSVGEAWYSGHDHVRSAAGVRAACAHGNPWPQDEQPIVLYVRPSDKPDRRALRSCGLSLRDDYRLAGTVGGLQIYLPDGSDLPGRR